MRSRALLIAAGAALMLTQYVAVREIGSTFFSTELVILGAVIVTLLGPSLAYALADKLSPGVLAAWGVLSVATHLALPFGLRALVGGLAARGFDTWAMAVTVVCGCLLLCGFYAVFLPRVAGSALSLPALYAAELCGALLALALLVVSPSWRVTLGVFWAAAVVVVHLGLARRLITGVVLAGAVAAAALYPRLDDAATRAYYAGYHGLDAPVVVATTYSAYERVDVIDHAGGRSLYLDGVPFFADGDGDSFNALLAGVPGALLPDRRRGHGAGRGAALVIGSGSFSSASRLHHLGYDVTVVELDAAVARLGFRHFGHVHRLAAGDVRLVIDDGRRFLAHAAPGSYAVIALDVPAPYHLQTAMLHTPAFYRLVASRLAPGGVASISLCDSLDGPVGSAIAASAAAAFAEIAVIETTMSGPSHLYGGAPLPFRAIDARAALDLPVGEDARALEDAEVRAAVAGVAPLDQTRLAAVLVLARDTLP